MACRFTASAPCSPISNKVRFGKGQTVTILATPTPAQHRALLLLGVTPKAEM